MLPGPISLDEGWLAMPSGDSTAETLAHVEEWAGEDARLLRVFDLPPIGETCLQYILMIDQMPPGTQVEVNGQPFGPTDGRSFRADVTDAVTLENNRVVLTVHGAGAIRGVRIVAEACG